MISWMQKHNKYLVWTIWVATFAFIGAGFVGWGSYDLGSKAGSIAKVGTIEVPQTKLNMVYNNIYSQYNEALNGKLDEKKVKEMGLLQQAFRRVEIQTKILNFAKDSGVIVSNNEVSNYLQSMEIFQKEGKFNQESYKNYLKYQRIQTKIFEENVREEIMITKMLSLLNSTTLPFEETTIAAAMNVADKIMYQILKEEDLTIEAHDTELKAYWEKTKENYMTKKQYLFSASWTESTLTTVSDEELKTYFESKNFNYTDAEGKQLSFENAKVAVTKDLKLRKTKKAAQKNYIAFKKGKLTKLQQLTLDVNDLTFSPAVWNAIKEKSIGDIIKPKIVSDKYVTLKIDNITKPKLMTFENAKKLVTQEYLKEAKEKALDTLAKETLLNLNDVNATVSEFITLESSNTLKNLNSQESLQFVQKLFTSLKEKGIIRLVNKTVVYKIVDQKILSADENRTNFIKQTANQLKQRTFESNLIKILDKKYPTEVYRKGLRN